MAATPHFEIQGGANKQRFELDDAAGEVVIGRSSECQWAIPSSGISRKHARVSRHGTDVMIEDLGSSNGTFVNNERLSAPRALRDQDLVRLGSVEIRFWAPEPEPESGIDATVAASATTAPPPSPTSTPPVSPAPAAGEPPPPSDRSAGTGSTTRSMAPPPPSPPAAAPAPASHPAPDIVPPPPAAKAPPAARQPAPAWPAVPDDGTEPTLVELAAIGAGSFLLVFALGALLIRFVF